jgi:hypothetical protein
MSKKRSALLLTGALLIPPASALGSENISSVVRSPAPPKDFAAYLPALPPRAPWLSLDARTKLPKGDFPLGREADGIGRLALPSALPTDVAANQRASATLERRM